MRLSVCLCVGILACLCLSLFDFLYVNLLDRYFYYFIYLFIYTFVFPSLNEHARSFILFLICIFPFIDCMFP